MIPAIGQRWGFVSSTKRTQYVAEIIGIDEKRCILRVVQVIRNDDLSNNSHVSMNHVFIANTLLETGPSTDWWAYLDGQDRPN